MECRNNTLPQLMGVLALTMCNTLVRGICLTNCTCPAHRAPLEVSAVYSCIYTSAVSHRAPLEVSAVYSCIYTSAVSHRAPLEVSAVYSCIYTSAVSHR